MKAPARLLHRALPAQGGIVQLEDAAVHHAHVLRLEPRDAVVLFDGRGREATAVVVHVSDGSCAVEAEAPREAASNELGRMVLVQAWPKADKIDSIVRMATELGVSEVRIVESRHVVARAENDRRARRVERLVRIAEEAARQSGRAEVPNVVDGGSLPDALAAAPSSACRWVAHERATKRLADEARNAAAHTTDALDVPEAWVVVGPEGGLAADEVARAEELGWVAVRIAPGVLRVETAAPVALALVLDATWRR